ncbi:MAG TPA: ABC transporter permease, partial [Gemmatimonadaceae bacterium]|nr:ABC transporter permease [Gemmatimonadaceae bacterium]
MRALDRKLFRDLRRMRGQILSIAGVVGCGVASVVAMGSTLQTIQRARDSYYATARFADVFASLTRAPESVAEGVRAIPGVTAVVTRVAVSALLEVPRLAGPGTGYFVSLDPARDPAINLVRIRSGRMVSAGHADEVLVEEHFADANTLRVGDSLGAVINGRWRRLHIVGVAISPEFVHAAAAGFAQFGDSRQFGIFWMHRDALGPLYGMDGSFNDVALTLAPGASEKAVIARLDALLDRYGGGHAYGRADQVSNRVITGEIEQLRAFGIVMPAIFLAVAAFLINVVLSRLIATQRSEIASLKAFGYANGEIAAHFTGYALAAVVGGALMGIPLGVWVGRRYTGLYAPFFHFPDFRHHTSLPLVLLAVVVSAVAAVLGAVGAVRAAVALPPAEGMRPPSPPVYRPLLLERLGFVHLLPSSVRMVLRTVEHRPLRTLASVLGVAMAAAVLVSGIFAFDVARYMGHLQFRVVEREDVTVAFTQPRPARVRHELAAVKGVRAVEGFRAVAVRIRNG